jgi:hypothetical protein
VILPRLLYGAWLTAAGRHHRALTRALGAPQGAQDRLLRRLLRRQRETLYGRRYGFGTIDSVAAFRRRVPLVRYGDLEAEIAAIRGGTPGVLTAEPVRRLVPTGGTTGGAGSAKLLPFTAALGRDFARGVGAWMVDLAARYPAIRSGPAYWSISPAMDAGGEAASAGVPVGFDDDAAYLGRWLEPLVSRTLIAPRALRHARPLEAFQYATLRCLLAAEALRLISVWHPSFLGILLEKMPLWWDALVADVARGTLTPPTPLPAGVQRALVRGCRADRRRGETLRTLGPEAPASTLWPHLAVVSAWGDGAARGPLATLADVLPGVAVQPKGLLATEAFVTLPFEGGYPFALHSAHFELLEEDGTPRGVHEAREGATYEVVVTTAGGLYRYRLGDRVRVDGWVGATPSVRLVGRADRVVDRVGEKLSEAFVAEAIARAYGAAGEGAPPAFTLLVPHGDGYALLMDRAPRAPEALAVALTAELRRSAGFAYAQDLGQLGTVGLAQVPPDATERFLAHHHGAGRTLGEIKAAFLEGGEGWLERLDGHILSGEEVNP